MKPFRLVLRDFEREGMGLMAKNSQIKKRPIMRLGLHTINGVGSAFSPFRSGRIPAGVTACA